LETPTLPKLASLAQIFTSAGNVGVLFGLGGSIGEQCLIVARTIESPIVHDRVLPPSDDDDHNSTRQQP
jgi:hypothetical protein